RRRTRLSKRSRGGAGPFAGPVPLIPPSLGGWTPRPEGASTARRSRDGGRTGERLPSRSLDRLRASWPGSVPPPQGRAGQHHHTREHQSHGNPEQPRRVRSRDRKRAPELGRFDGGDEERGGRRRSLGGKQRHEDRKKGQNVPG